MFNVNITIQIHNVIDGDKSIACFNINCIIIQNVYFLLKCFIKFYKPNVININTSENLRAV